MTLILYFILLLRHLKIIESRECRPARGFLSEAQAFKEPVGDHIPLLYEAVDWIALSVESLGHGADQDFGVAFPSVLG